LERADASAAPEKSSEENSRQQKLGENIDYSPSGWLRIERTWVSGQKVAWIWLCRTDVRNAFNEVLIQELESIFALLGKEEGLRAIVLAADGSTFCAGADLNWMRRSVTFSFEDNVHDAQALSRMLKVIQSCPRPVIARLQGSAFGGGVGLIAACDLAVAVQSARFCLSEVKLGLIPAVISPFVLQKMDIASAKWAFLTAEAFSAEEARRLHLINQVVADESSLNQAVNHLLMSLVANGPEALTQCKVLFAKLSPIDWQRAVDVTTKLIAERRTSAEGQEGMTAFLEKRPPQWQVPADVESLPG
jgi:methylglutaconyl-CoA hydratase